MGRSAEKVDLLGLTSMAGQSCFFSKVQSNDAPDGGARLLIWPVEVAWHLTALRGGAAAACAATAGLAAVKEYILPRLIWWADEKLREREQRNLAERSGP
eukprot:scaffold317100_cov37-Prasinocladus_malaysianus.AAC.1